MGRRRTHRKREWTVIIFKFWGKARYYVNYSERESACVVGVEVERGAQELFMDSAVCISSGIGSSFYFYKSLFILLCWVLLVAYRI